MRTVRVGTRGSLLALTQSDGVRRELARRFPKTRFELVVVKTTGDEYQTVELFKKNNVGVFTKELERKLLSKEIDVAVHSLKDLPTDLPKGLVLAAFPPRLDPSDVLISKKKYTLSTLPKGARVATGSPRRKEQLRIARPDLRLFDIRGNLDTRIGRVLDKNDFEAVVLARAGLMRLKKFRRYARPLPTDRIMPAVGQAALGVEARAADGEVLAMLKKLDHGPTRVRVEAERAFLKTLRGGCRVPVGVDTKLSGGRLSIRARVFSVKGGGCVEGSASGSVRSAAKAASALAKKLLSKGAGRLLAEARRAEGAS